MALTILLHALVAIVCFFIGRMIVRQSKKCHHAFDPDQVHDLNKDPVCLHCNIYYSKLAEKRKYQFVWNEKQQHYNIKRA